MKPKVPLLYSIYATYGRIQMTEMPKILKKTSMAGDKKGHTTTLHASAAAVVVIVNVYSTEHFKPFPHCYWEYIGL